GHGAVLDVAAAERGAHVRAGVVDGVVLALMQEHRDQFLVHLDRMAFAFLHLADPADRAKLAHVTPSGNPPWISAVAVVMIITAPGPALVRIRPRGRVMLEIEVKYPAGDLAAVRQQLVAWGATLDAEREDSDQYFNAPDRDFARTDEAVRLRRIGGENFLT